MSPTQEQVIAGQAVYTDLTLLAYDLFVLGLSNTWLWKCPTALLRAHYEKHVSNNHLEVGVGTGYFPDKCRFPSDSPRIALMDLNLSTIDYASKRIARYNPEAYQQNILEPIAGNIQKFDSVCMNYLLHCVPGAISEKAVAFDHVKAIMNPGAVVFGATILQGGVSRNWGARQLMKLYNTKGIFSNDQDTLEALETALQSRFRHTSIRVEGCVALFSART
ncbi:MAG: class I SAM-dependent methyltransferase [Hahellaceae bacterium]|jgi:hypothetical protein|nr:class I SAM-dependent methyltransferase [Hahellaceae bacterium]